MPVDAALTGAALPGGMALLSQAIAKCKCHVSCRRDETGEYCELACVCGFLDAPLFQPDAKDKDESEPP